MGQQTVVAEHLEEFHPADLGNFAPTYVKFFKVLRTLHILNQQLESPRAL